MEGIDYLEDALKAMNTGAADLNSKTLAQINAMNIELKNADGSLAGKYKLSEFLENVIYSYLSTTKASSLASVLGVTGVVQLSPTDNIDNLSPVQQSIKYWFTDQRPLGTFPPDTPSQTNIVLEIERQGSQSRWIQVLTDVNTLQRWFRVKTGVTLSNWYRIG